MLDPIETKLTDRYKKLSEYDNHLERLNELIDWKIFLPLIDKAFKRERKSPVGRKSYNKLMMFKILILQALYNLSIVEQLQAQGQKVNDEDLAHISLLIYKHVIPMGSYFLINSHLFEDR